eukprot:295952_1
MKQQPIGISNEWQNICVMARFRPTNSIEKPNSMNNNLLNLTPTYTIENSTITLKRQDKSHRKHDFEYKAELDHIFDLKSTQNEVFETSTAPLMNEALNGYNTTFLTYGETGSGKKYSMFGPNRIILLLHGYVRDIYTNFPIDLMNLLQTYCDYIHKSSEFFHQSDSDTFGIVPKSLIYLFDKLQTKCNQQIIQNFSISMQILEISRSNKKLFDLLNPNNTSQLRIKTDFSNQHYSTLVTNLTNINVTSAQEALFTLYECSRNRGNIYCKGILSGSPNRANILILLKMKQTKINGCVLISHVNFANLPGSDLNRIRNDKEALVWSLNPDLSSLYRCVNDLSKGQNPNYMNGRLTHLFQDAFGGNGKTVFLLCASIDMYNRRETIRTMRFGDRVKNVKNKPKINEILLEQKMEVKNVQLKRELSVVDDNTKCMQRGFQLNEMIELFEKEKMQNLELNECEEINGFKSDIETKEIMLSGIEQLQHQEENVFQSDSDDDLQNEIDMEQRNQEFESDMNESEVTCWSSIFLYCT